MNLRGSCIRTAAAALVAVAMASAGCDAHSKPIVASPLPSHPSNGASPHVSPTPSGSDSGSPSPVTSATPSPSGAPSSPAGSSPLPAIPSELASKYPEETAKVPAAIETVRNFFDGVNHEIDTGDEAAAIATFTSKCQLCGATVYGIKQHLDGGHTLRGGHLHLISVDSAAPSYSQVVTIKVTEKQDPAQELDSHGNVVLNFPPAPPTRQIFDLELDVSPPKIWMLTTVNQ